MVFLFDVLQRKFQAPTREEALPGRDRPVETAETHFVNGRPLKGPWPEGFKQAAFGMGCFWGAEKMFWTLDGVWVTAAGYMGGHTRNPTYHEVCSGLTGHTEIVHVVFDPAAISYPDLLKVFWEGHDPTQGMRQGNDIGTQYRSFIGVYDDDQRRIAKAGAESYGRSLAEAGYNRLTTEIVTAGQLYYAEGYHQQYLARNPDGYCGHGGTGIACAGG